MDNPLAAPSQDEESGPLVTRAELKRELAKLERASASAIMATSSGGGSGAASQAVYARLTEAPTNWHQASVFALVSDAPEDAPLKARAPFQFGIGFAMVACQVRAPAAAAAAAGSGAADHPTLLTHSHSCAVHPRALAVPPADRAAVHQ